MLDDLPLGSPGESVIAAAMRALWSDPAHPENRTFCIRNKKTNVPYVMGEEGWVPRAEQELYPTMISRAVDELNDRQNHAHPNLVPRCERLQAAFEAESAMKDWRKAAQIIRPLGYATAGVAGAAGPAGVPPPEAGAKAPPPSPPPPPPPAAAAGPC